MKTLIYFLSICIGLAGVDPLWAQDMSQADFERLEGVTLGYSYRALGISGSKLNQNPLFMHMADVGLITWFGDYSEFYGSIGVTVGILGQSEPIGISENRFTPDGRRLLGLPGSTQLAYAAAKFKIIWLMQERNKKFTSNYLYTDIEVGALFPRYNIATGGFNNYVLSRQSIDGFTSLLNVGFKWRILEIYGGPGILAGFYNKGFRFELFDEDGEAVNISDNPGSTTHFVYNAGIGLRFDF